MRTMAKIGLAVFIVMLGGLGGAFYWANNNARRAGSLQSTIVTNASDIDENKDDIDEFRHEMVKIERQRAQSDAALSRELGRIGNSIESINQRLDRNERPRRRK